MESRLSTNKIWLAIVLLHVGGSVTTSLAGVIPYGNACLAAAIWICAGFFLEKNKLAGSYLLCLGGWGSTLLLFYFLDSGFQATLLLNEMLLLYVLWACRKEYASPGKYCPVKKVSLPMLPVLAAAVVCLFAAADYVNICSMLFFKNLVDDSMQSLTLHPAAGIIAAAVVPAFVEEIYFRGFIFHGISDKRKAVLVSAFLFALMHMNFNQMCYAFFMGLLFGLVICVTDNLAVSMSMHMLFNGISIIFACFYDMKAVKSVMKWNIAGYAPFNPCVTDASGHLLWGTLLSGGVIFFCCLAAGVSLIFLLGKLQNISERDVQKQADVRMGKGAQKQADVRMRKDAQKQKDRPAAKWKPDLGFFAACGLCLITAVLYEVIL